MNRLSSKILLIFLILFVVKVEASVGTVVNQTATVPLIQRDRATIPATKGTGIEMNDVIKTTLGRASINFLDDTKVEVNENSRLVIDDFVYDPKNSSSSKLALKFASGTVRYASGAIAHNNPRSVNINTPSATVGVRGTDFTATVDDTGASTVILLPSCPEGFHDVETDCVTGAIEVSNDAGTVVLDQPFQGTTVYSRQITPAKPVVLNVTADQINNLLIVSPPKPVTTSTSAKEKKDDNGLGDTALTVNALKQNFLKNELESSEDVFADSLLPNPTQFIKKIVTQLKQQIVKNQTDSNSSSNISMDASILPDYNPSSKVVATITDTKVILCKTDGNNMQCIGTPKDADAVITQVNSDGSTTNRVNKGNGTVITIRQN